MKQPQVGEIWLLSLLGRFEDPPDYFERELPNLVEIEDIDDYVIYFISGRGSDRWYNLKRKDFILYYERAPK